MGRNDLAPLSLSQRSNGLAFSPRHFPGSPNRNISKREDVQRPVKSLVSPKPTRGPYIKNSLCLVSEDDPKYDPRPAGLPSPPVSPPPQAIRRVQSPPYRSLLNIGMAVGSKPIPDRAPPARSLLYSYHTAPRSRPASIYSVATTTASWVKRMRQPASLSTMPYEILDEICRCVPQDSLRSLMLVSHYFLDAAAIAMYDTPQFASTYRFAQFVTTVSEQRDYADMVRNLDISTLASTDPDDEERPSAGWREWKYRTEPLYTLMSPERQTFAASQLMRISESSGGSHPPPSPFLSAWHTIRDVPIGGILHLLRACQRIKYLNLSNTTLAHDCRIVTNDPCYRPTAFTRIIFVSDVAKSHTWKPKEISKVDHIDIVDAIVALPQLRRLEVRSAPWLSTNMVQKIAQNCPQIDYYDLCDSGMKTTLSWAISGGPADLAEALMSPEQKAERAKAAAKALEELQW